VVHVAPEDMVVPPTPTQPLPDLYWTDGNVQESGRQVKDAGVKTLAKQLSSATEGV